MHAWSFPRWCGDLPRVNCEVACSHATNATVRNTRVAHLPGRTAACRSEYDRGVNTFSPEGRLFQVRIAYAWAGCSSVPETACETDRARSLHAGLVNGRDTLLQHTGTRRPKLQSVTSINRSSEYALPL
jgi:hypothetical protein